MTEQRCFKNGAPIQFDVAPFKCEHTLQGHPALELENLSRVVQRLPKDQVFYSSGKLAKDADFDRAHLDHATGLSLKDTIENMMTSNSYVMIRAPEQDPSFHDLYQQLLGEIRALTLAQCGSGDLTDPMLYLFIASPNSVTPFHIDRYSTMLMQFRGRKSVHVYPAWDERVLAAEAVEAFVVKNGGKVPYDPAVDTYATQFEFGPGDALHIPFVAPHYVRNGSDDVSISLSIIFNTPVTQRHLNVFFMNNTLRRKLGRWGFRPTPVNASPRVDSMKNAVRVALNRVRARG